MFLNFSVLIPKIFMTVGTKIINAEGLWTLMASGCHCKHSQAAWSGPKSITSVNWENSSTVPCVRLCSHKHEYVSGTARVPVYELRQTRVCLYFNGCRSHTCYL